MEIVLRILVRLAGIFILVSGVRGIIPYVVMFKQGDAILAFDQVGFAGQALIILIGVVLVLAPGILGMRSLVGAENGQGATGSFDAAAVSRVLTSIVGLYFLADGIISVAYYLAYWFQYQAQAGQAQVTFPAPADLVAGVWSTVAELVIGAVLIVACGRVSRLLRAM